MIFAISGVASAQQLPTGELPQYLEGEWINNAAARVYSGRIAFKVDNRAADGSIAGRCEGRLGGDGKVVAGSDVDVFLDPK